MSKSLLFCKYFRVFCQYCLPSLIGTILIVVESQKSESNLVERHEWQTSLLKLLDNCPWFSSSNSVIHGL